MAPKRVAANQILTGRHVYPAEGVKRQRVALLAGCAQQVLRPSINQSTIRVLNRLGCDVVVVNGEGAVAPWSITLAKRVRPVIALEH